MELSRKFDDRTANICVVGLGYVGLPTAVSFAEKGFRVIGADKKSEVVGLINRGGCHLEDLDLDGRVKKVVQDKKLTATIDTAEATRKSDAIDRLLLKISRLRN